MLKSLKALEGYTLGASDGEVGKVSDFLFDDRSWAVRYLVVDTGGWLSGRKVLISPISLEAPDWEEGVFPVRCTRQQVEDAPPLDEHAPVSREYERSFYEHYGHGLYWVGADLWGTSPDPWGALHPVSEPEPPPDPEELEPKENHLRSADEVAGYDIHASDGELGQVDDFLVDDADWAIRWLVVDTRKWLPGRKVLIPPEWVQEVDWVATAVTFDLSRERIKDSPEFDPTQPLTAELEQRVRDHYGRPPRR